MIAPKRERVLNGLSAEEIPLYHARFLAKFERRGANECWPWTGSLREFGYGQMCIKGSLITSHRLAYFFETGQPLRSSVVIRHACDNPRCVNPRHLLPGTNLDNIRDRVERGRSRGGFGENNKAKLREAQVREIKASPDSPADLAKRYNVSRATIYAIKTGFRWKHVA